VRSFHKGALITGIGIVSSLGIGKKIFWSNFKKGKSGISQKICFKNSLPKSKKAGWINKINFDYYLKKQNSRYLSRSVKLLLTAVSLALKDAKIKNNQKLDMGIILGEAVGTLSTQFRLTHVNQTEGPNFVSPIEFANALNNSMASQVAIKNGIKGFNLTISSGFSSGLDALGYAAMMLNNKRIKKAIVGASEALSKELWEGFNALGLLKKSRQAKNKSKNSISALNSQSGGICLGEGAAILVLENQADYNKGRNNALAQIIGWGNAFGGGAQAMKRAMILAIQDAEVKAEDVDCCFMGSNKDTKQELHETRAIKDVFLSNKKLMVRSIKSLTGECYSASGPMQCAAGALAIANNFVPPLLNKQQNRKSQVINTVLINSCGCDGNNSTIILRRVK